MRHVSLPSRCCLSRAAGALGLLSLVAAAAPAAAQGAPPCSRFPEARSSAFDPAKGMIDLPYRQDFAAATAGPAPHYGDFAKDWRGYMASVLGTIRQAGFRIDNRRVSAPPSAAWWIAPWLDLGNNGRERVNGLTKERGPDPGDLSPQSGSGIQVWAVGFYDARGASALKEVFADPCDPNVPATGFAFPEGTTSFKLLFTDADPAVVPYLEGAPVVDGFIDPPGSGSSADPNRRTVQRMRLLQVDIAVRTSAAAATSWVFGTFVWKGPPKGDGLYDNLVPVGLMWGNDPSRAASPIDAFAQLDESRLNPDLAGTVWQAAPGQWPLRPWPGLHGRVNGPADNLRSSCLSCHALAQWPRSRDLQLASRASFADLAKDEVRDEIRAKYMRNTLGGSLVNPTEANPSPGWGGARPLDYSLQIEAGLSRMCQACARGALSGATPALCRVEGHRNVVRTETCPSGSQPRTYYSLIEDEEPPRQ